MSQYLAELNPQKKFLAQNKAQQGQVNCEKQLQYQWFNYENNLSVLTPCICSWWEGSGYARYPILDVQGL